MIKIKLHVWKLLMHISLVLLKVINCLLLLIDDVKTVIILLLEVLKVALDITQVC